MRAGGAEPPPDHSLATQSPTVVVTAAPGKVSGTAPRSISPRDGAGAGEEEAAACVRERILTDAAAPHRSETRIRARGGVTTRRWRRMVMMAALVMWPLRLACCCLPWLPLSTGGPGGVMDVTLINFGPTVGDHKETALLCVAGERDVDLRLTRELEPVMSARQAPRLESQRDSRRVNTVRLTLSARLSWARLGVFSCLASSRRGADMAVLTTTKISERAFFLPSRPTVTVSRGETASIEMMAVTKLNEDIMWLKNGSFDTTTPVSEVVQGKVTLHIANATPAHAGVYCARYVSNSWLLGACTRLIVRRCPADLWGLDCARQCPACLHGGVCHEDSGTCVCPPGFMGPVCETGCGDNAFGSKCSERCKDGGCNFYTFCLPDPYGCSCATGWHGPDCDKPCGAGDYGPNCRFKCECERGAPCDPFRGCVCPEGWKGTRCEQEALTPPCILEPLDDLEINARTRLQLNCSATGFPTPRRDNIELLRPDGSKLSPASSSTERNVTTSTFKLAEAKVTDDGEWRCRVETPAGRDEKSFRVAFKVPPSPESPPRLVQRFSTALMLDLMVTPHKGDGPLQGARLIYTSSSRPAEKLCDVYLENVSSYLLGNLQPLTNYSLRVQLQRPGPEGSGPRGPEAMLQTDCPDPTVAPVLGPVAATGRTEVRVAWSLPAPPPVVENAEGVVLLFHRPADGFLREVKVPGLEAQERSVQDLEPDHRYSLHLLLYNCGSRGPPSQSHSFLLGSLGPSVPLGLRARALNQTAVRLSWEPPSSHRGRIVRYLVEWRRAPGSGAGAAGSAGPGPAGPAGSGSSSPAGVMDAVPREAVTPGDRAQLTAAQLQPASRYSFRVRAHAQEPGAWSEAITAWTHSNRPPPAPTDVHIYNTTDTAATVSWSVAEGHFISAIILRYKVYGDREPLDRVVKLPEGGEAGPVHSEARITGLEPERPYLLEIVARNNVGESSPNIIRELRTLSTIAVMSQDRGGGGDAQATGGPAAGPEPQLLLAVMGSVAVTCLTILLVVLVLLCLRGSVFRRRRTFIYPPGLPPPEPISYPVLDWDDIKFEDMIGEGNFGQVIKALVKKDGTKINVAIKMLKEFASEDDHRDFAGELEVLCKLGHHPNIINLIGACEHRGYLYIAIEFAAFGNLLDFLRKSRVLETDPAFAKEHGTASTLSSQQLLQFAADVAKGMQYLSEKQFIHRDLAARNILVAENYVAKIADFGLSRGEEVYVKKTMGRLPVRWMAIESLNYSVYTSKSDVWSFGVLLWEIVSLGGTPYCGMTCAELYEKLPQGFRMEKPLSCDDEVYELMRQCWRDRPNERPPFSQVCVSLNRMLEARKAYVNTALFENFTYAGIDCSAEEA
ncbi:tyrosine-protein kinase receptor Tie-1 isoform X2 [Lampetra planeri]